MPTLQNLIDRTRQYLYGFSQEQQQWTYLNQSLGIGTGDTAFTVNDASQISRGLIEMDGAEMMQVQTVNRQTNVVTLNPWSRGWQGSGATTHANGARIENNPVFPTIRVTEAINDTIRSVYPDLFAVGTTKFTKVSVQYQYPLPAAAEEVVSIKYQIIGPSKQYPWPKKWRFDGQADPTDFSTGKAIWVGEEITPGREIFVTYKQEPTELVNPADDFVAVTGLPETVQDVIIYGACMKLSATLDVARLLLDSVEASEKAAYVQPGSAGKVSTYFGQLYSQRMQQEARKLADRYQSPAHFDA